jgi:branched-chain amino acid transport system substrate-binding protein
MKFSAHLFIFRLICLSGVVWLSSCALLEQPPVTRNPRPAPKKATAHKNAKNTRPASTPAADTPESLLTSFRADMRAKNYSAALADSDTLLQKSPLLPPAQAVEILRGRMVSHEAMGDPVQAVLDAQNVLLNPSLQNDAEPFRIRSAEIIEGKLSPEQLQQLADNLKDSSLHAQVLFRQGQISLDNKDQSAARKYFAQVISLNPNSDLGKRAQDLLDQLEAVRRVEPKTVGVVLPLTGKFSAIAEKTLRGVQMGLGLYKDNVSSFKLAVVDSEGNPDTARKGVERLVKEDNVISIIGSVLSKTAPGVASKSAELGVPDITLAQKSGVTELGSTVFRNSLTSEMQVRFLAKTAIEKLGMKRFAILFPNDQYGVEYANIFWDEILARGGSITSAQSYSPKETDFRYVVQRLVGTYYLEDRADEYKARLKDWSEHEGKRMAGRNTPPEDLLPPSIDFDAIFIPDSAKTLGQISAMLAYNNVRDVKLLGTNLWNVPGLAKRAGNSSRDLVFVDSFVSSDPKFQNSSFVRDYKNLFGEEPGIFEIQGYDSALMLRQLISSGNSSRESLALALNKLHDFQGALGAISVTSDREMLRPLEALTLQNGEITTLNARLTP